MIVYRCRAFFTFFNVSLFSTGDIDSYEIQEHTGGSRAVHGPVLGM